MIDMKPSLKWTLLAVVVALLVAGGMRTLTARKAQQAALQAQQAAQKTQVSIELRPSDLIEVKVRELALTVPLSGSVQAVKTALVKARISGELQGLTVREGDSVKLGQVLGRIDPTEAQARLRQASAQAQAAKAQTDIAQRSYDNNVALVTQGFISDTALVASRNSLAAAQATYAAAQAAVDGAAKSVADAVLRAPIGGQVAQRLAQPGERLGVDARIVEIVDLHQLEMAAALSAAEALQVKVGQNAVLHADGSDQTVAARVLRINPSTSPGSRAVTVYLAVAPGTALRHGQYVQGTLTVGSLKAPVLPLTAIRTDQPRPYVQVVKDGKVQYQSVQALARSEVDGQTLVAVSGVAPATTVLDGSVGVLRQGMQVVLATQP